MSAMWVFYYLVGVGMLIKVRDFGHGWFTSLVWAVAWPVAVGALLAELVYRVVSAPSGDKTKTKHNERA